MVMFLLLAFGFSLLLVGGQVLWKQGIIDVMGGEFVFSKIINLILHPKVIVGGIIYIAATLLFFYLQTKYAFSKVQLVAIPLAMFFSIMAGYFIFDESLSRLNYLGAALVFVGVLLLAARTAS